MTAANIASDDARVRDACALEAALAESGLTVDDLLAWAEAELEDEE